MSHLRTNKGQLAVVLLLGGLLFTLAIFQYRWLGELSEQERERMSRTLGWAAHNLRAEFDSELAELYRQLQVDHNEEGSFAEQIAARYAERLASIDGPDILETIYWVQLDEESGLVLQEYTGAGLATLDEWPHELARLKPEFAKQLRNNDVQFDLVVGPAPLQDQIPALVIQQLFTRDRRQLGDYRSISWVIAKLRREGLFDELIPALSDEHIYAEGASDYNIGVTRLGDPGALLYASKPGLTAASFAEPDAERTMYALRIWHFNQRFGPNRRIWNVVEEHAEPRWNLVVQHQAGSLEAAVAAQRNRSLAISLGVLALLGVSVAMIVVSTRRAQRLAAQQMEFVAGVSHELRTPLAVIRAAGENLADEVVGDPERTRQYGDLINREGRRLSDMVERVLLFAKMRAGSMTLQKQPVDLAAAIDEAVESIETWIDEKSLSVKREVPDDLPDVAGDPAALSSVLQNLISNAVKYSRDGGTVTVQVRNARDNGGDAVQIAIHDQGEGIPGREIPRLFEPFFRGENARRKQIQGSGLGLSLVKQVVEAHGGTIEVESAPGAGSTFFVQLPVGGGKGTRAG